MLLKFDALNFTALLRSSSTVISTSCDWIEIQGNGSFIQGFYLQSILTVNRPDSRFEKSNLSGYESIVSKYFQIVNKATFQLVTHMITHSTEVTTYLLGFGMSSIDIVMHFLSKLELKKCRNV